MKEDNVTKILFEGWWEFEYNNDDGTLTGNKSVCIGKVPKEEISNALFMIEVMYSSYGFITGEYSQLCNFFQENYN